MAENPATWTEAEHIVRKVLDEERALRQDGQVVIGLSLERRITDALRRANLLADSSDRSELPESLAVYAARA